MSRAYKKDPETSPDTFRGASRFNRGYVCKGTLVRITLV